MLRLNLSVKPTAKPNRLGVLGGDLQGFPNGRRLTDDVVDIELQALEGAAQTGKPVGALAGGDGVNANDHRFGKSFPYVALPNVGAVNQGGGSASTTQAPAAAPTQPASTRPAEASINAAPAAYSTPDNTVNTVIIATVGAVAVALAALLITGWLMRRRRPAAVATPTGHIPPPAVASGPDEPTIQS